MAKERLRINTRTMPKTSVSTAARKVCQWSDFITFSVTVPKVKVGGGEGREGWW